MLGTSGNEIAAAVERILSAQGPMTEEALLDALGADGIHLGPDAEDVLTDVLDEEVAAAVTLTDERLAWLPTVLDGRVFTHRLTAAETQHDMLTLNPDLTPLSALTDSPAYRRLTDGSRIAEAFPSVDSDMFAKRGIAENTVDPNGVLLLPPGRLSQSGVSAGDLVGLRVSEDGFELCTVADPAPCGIASALAGLISDRDDQPEMVDIAVWTVCAGDHDMLREPAEPLGDLLSAGGLHREGDWFAGPGFDIGQWRINTWTGLLRARYGLGDDEARAVAAIVRLYDETVKLVDAGAETPWAGGDPETVRDCLKLLREPAVAAAVLAETRTADDRTAIALGTFAETMEPMAPRAARPALRWLRANAYEQLGDVEQAEATYLAAESLDSSWPLTLVSLARYAGDRGDAERGLALLRRAGAPRDDELVVLLDRFQAAPRPGIGRNDRCWCGSGRKYKVCHLRREQLPLEERASWLYQKAGANLLEGRYGPLLIETLEQRARHWDFPGALEHAIRDGLSFDAVLFEGGAFADFLAVRGSLLPEDERLLAAQWLLVQRSVHQVVAVRPGHGMTLRDVRTGDVHEVREQAASRHMKAGEMYCARVVPAGESMQIFGGAEPVSLGLRDELIALLDGDPDPVQLVAMLSRRFVPPALQNTEGEPLVLCDATLQITDRATLVEALDDEYDRDYDRRQRQSDNPDGTLTWYEHVFTDGMERIRAQIELSGDRLHIHANSEARFERALDTIDAMDPGAEVLSQTREPAGDLAAVQRLSARTPDNAVGVAGPAVDAADEPTIAAVLDEFVRNYEAAWLDESLPALSGRTPRQCADDPTRLPDLLLLLDSFPDDTGRPGAMSPARLRAALGLPADVSA